MELKPESYAVPFGARPDQSRKFPPIRFIWISQCRQVNEKLSPSKRIVKRLLMYFPETQNSATPLAHSQFLLKAWDGWKLNLLPKPTIARWSCSIEVMRWTCRPAKTGCVFCSSQ